MITNKKDLRGGNPLWIKSLHSTVRTRTALKQENCDVVVVGAGVSGALTALMLTEKGFDVVVVDRRKPTTGSTAASTAMIQFELDTPLTELSEKIGAKNACRAYQRSLRAVDDLQKLISRHKIKAEWRKRDALYLAGNEMGFRALQSEAKERRNAGLPSTYIDHDYLLKTYGIDRTGAIVSQGAAELNPTQLTAGALRAAQSAGCRIYQDHEVTKVESNTSGVCLATSQGGTINATRVVFATGYETIKGLPTSKFDITSSWAIATKPIAPERLWPTRCLIWEASDPYLYMRTTADHRILIGGEDSGLTDPDRRDAAIPAKSEKLLRAAKALLPNLELEVAYAWAGAFAVSPTGLPIITELDGRKNQFAILGCGGNGITFSMIAAQLVLAWAKGNRDRDMDLFKDAGK